MGIMKVVKNDIGHVFGPLTQDNAEGLLRDLALRNERSAPIWIEDALPPGTIAVPVAEFDEIMCAMRDIMHRHIGGEGPGDECDAKTMWDQARAEFKRRD